MGKWLKGLAEREGFEPPLPVRVNLISSPSRTTSHKQHPLLTQKNQGGKMPIATLDGERCGMVQAQFGHRIRHSQGTGRLFSLAGYGLFQDALDRQSSVYPSCQVKEVALRGWLGVQAWART